MSERTRGFFRRTYQSIILVLAIALIGGAASGEIHAYFGILGGVCAGLLVSSIDSAIHRSRE